MDTKTQTRTWQTFFHNVWQGMGRIFITYPEYPVKNWRNGFVRDRRNLRGDVRRVFDDVNTAVREYGDKA